MNKEEIERLEQENNAFKKILEFTENADYKKLSVDEIILLKEHITKLEKENKKLKELCDKYEQEHKTTYEIWKKDIYLYNSVVDRNERLNNIINEIETMCKNEYCKKNTTDIDSIGISNNIWVMIYLKIKELKEKK